MVPLGEPGLPMSATGHPPLLTQDHSSTQDAIPITVIEPRSGWQFIRLGELWRFRELLFFLTWRDVKIRYKQTILGVAWAFAQPLAAMLVFVIFMGRMGGASSMIPNYGLFVFAGMLGWMFFANSLSTAGNSILNNERLVTKVYFPRVLIPISCVGAALFDFLIGSVVLTLLMIWYGVTPTAMLLLVPLIFGMLLIAAMGLGIFLSALIVVQRDFRYVLQFGLQLWMFATPAIYLTNDAFGPLTQTFLPLNPAHGLLLNFRQCILGGPLDLYALAVSSMVSLLGLFVGLLFFQRVQKSFADLI